MDLTTKPGAVNTPMDSMGMPAEQLANKGILGTFLPRVLSSSLTTVSATEATTVATTQVASPNLNADQVGNLSQTTAPGSAAGPERRSRQQRTGRDRHGAAAACHGHAAAGRDAAHLRRHHPGAWRRGLHRPAVIKFPNVFNAAPGTKLQVLSFDHTTGKLVFDRYATVSADGKEVPLDSRTGTSPTSWSEAVFGNEAGTPLLGHNSPGAFINGQALISPVTFAALPDLGYTVDLTLADPYALPKTLYQFDYRTTAAVTSSSSSDFALRSALPQHQASLVTTTPVAPPTTPYFAFGAHGMAPLTGYPRANPGTLYVPSAGYGFTSTAGIRASRLGFSRQARSRTPGLGASAGAVACWCGSRTGRHDPDASRGGVARYQPGGGLKPPSACSIRAAAEMVLRSP